MIWENWKCFFRKKCVNPILLWNEEFSLSHSRAATAPAVYTSHETVSDMTMAALFFAFQFGNLWQLLKFCSQKQPPALFQLNGFITYSHTRRVLLTWSKAKGSSRPFGLTFAIILLQLQLILCFTFRRFLGMTEFLQEKQIWNHLISKKSLATLYYQRLKRQALRLLPRCYHVQSQAKNSASKWKKEEGGIRMWCSLLLILAIINTINWSIMNTFNRCLLEIKSQFC